MSVELLAGVGVSVIEQKRGKGSVDWTEVGISAASGGASGVVGAGGSTLFSGLLDKAAGSLAMKLGEQMLWTGFSKDPRTLAVHESGIAVGVETVVKSALSYAGAE